MRTAIDASAVWHAADVADPTTWTIELADDQRDDLAAAARAAAAAGRTATTLTVDDFPLPTLTAILDRVVRDDMLTSDEARALCRVALASYFAGAMLMPYEPFLEAAEALRYDIELLGHRFRTSFEQVCHRVTTLRKPGALGVPFHFIRVDIAGNISKRFSGSGIRFARFAGACPRWNVFAAFLTPGMIKTPLAMGRRWVVARRSSCPACWGSCCGCRR